MLKKYLEAVGKICAEARERIGVTQKELAKTIGTSSINVCHFEHGRCNSLHILVAYLWFNIVTIDDLPLYGNWIAEHAVEFL